MENIQTEEQVNETPQGLIYGLEARPPLRDTLFAALQHLLAIFVAIISSVAMSGIPGGGGTGELALCTLFFPDQLAIAYPIALAIFYAGNTF